MSLKDIFASKVKQVNKSTSNETIQEEIESVGLYNEYLTKENTFVPPVTFDNPANFCFYGSAKSYYQDSISNVYKTYPYDGSLKEKYKWYNDATFLDKWMFDNKYPKSTGYAIFSSNGWGTKVGSLIGGYGEPLTKEYITIKGGPNTGSYTGNGLANAFTSSNIYDSEYNRLSNLRYYLSNGVTIEFWLKKDSFDNTKTEKEVIFDLWNGEASSSANYGRLTIELTGAVTGTPFLVTAQSGTSGFIREQVGSSFVTTSSLTNWHHYAISLKNNTTSGVDVKFYQDGLLKTTNTFGSGLFGEITGSLIANIASLRTAPSGTYIVSEGWGKLSGSLDEFRYWKLDRDSKQIYRNWSTTVDGGTNTDDEIDANLGIYYKFNEGITLTSSFDSKVLDYSGRFSNGYWNGYLSTSRNTGSAINLYTNNKFVEVGDPIIYSNNPNVVSLYDEYTESGSFYDSNNGSSLYNSIPSWIIEEDTSEDLLKLTQIISSYFDTLYLQIKYINSTKDFYDSKAESVKQTSLVKEALKSIGVVTPEIFIDTSLIEEILNKNEIENYDLTINQIKNLVYSNIYSNALALFKSKGTEKSFKYLLNCFGINDELVKINLYSNNVDFEFKNNLNTKSVKRKLINFFKQSNINSVVYQYKDSSNSNTSYYISGSGIEQKEIYLPFTIENQTYFPIRSLDIENLNLIPILTASLFGAHSAKSDGTDLTWPTNDYFDFRVYAIKESIEKNNAYFMLSSSNSAIPILTSSLYYDVYNNEKWNFNIRLKHNRYPFSDVVTGSSNDNYTLEFSGYNTNADVNVNNFNITSSITKADAINLLTSNKRLYVGADRTNFTGSVIKSSDIKTLGLRYYISYIDNEVLSLHSKDIENYGVLNANKPFNLLVSSLTGSHEKNTLVLDWSFDDLTGSNSSGEFIVNDLSSGSTSYDSSHVSWLSNIVERQHTGKGYEFEQSSESIYDYDYIVSAKLRLPEVLNSSDMINILERDDDIFVKSTRPSKFLTYLEKSMYQTISEEMINMFGTIVEFNNLIGNPVNKYRQEYKELGKLRQMFFNKVKNEPDIDKYLDYYKWIDAAVGLFLQQLVPASSDSINGLMNVVESHLLERNKYQHKFPTIEFKIPTIEDGADSINKHLYNWRIGHRPLSNLERDNCLYWNAKAERLTAPLSSSDASVNNTRSLILSSSLQALNRSFTTTYRFSTNKSTVLKGGINFEPNKNTQFFNDALAPHGPLDSDGVVEVPANYLFVGVDSTSSLLADCNDVIEPNKKIKYTFKTYHGRDYTSSSLNNNELLNSKIALPVNFISGNVQGGYQDQVTSEFMSGVIITNLHNDFYANSNETPAQGIFASTWVGGKQSRHVPVNQGSDTYTTRPEAWKLLLGTGSFDGDFETTLGFVGADYPYPEGNPDEPSYPVRAHKRATYYREETAKRPLNIKNIQSSTGSSVLGNYSSTYEILHTFGATSNNRSLVDAINPTINTELLSVLRTSIADGRVNFELPTRPTDKSVIITRFSSPGERRTMSRGYLNRYAEEMSPYNALPFKNREIIGDGKRNRDAFTHDKFGTPNILSGSKKPLNDLVAFYSDFGGYQSGSAQTVPSYHKTNRNRIYLYEYSGSSIVTGSNFDNGFVTHQIPQKDSGYSWVAASLSGTTTDASFGHILSTFSTPTGSSSVYKSLTLQSSSVYSSGLNLGIREDAVNYNSTNTLGTSTSISNYTSSVYFTSSLAEAFNALMLYRNSTYGYASFRQVRNKNNKVIINQNINNIMTTLDISGNVRSFSEPAVESSNLPIITKFNVNSTNVSLKHTYENNIQNFSNKEFNDTLNIPNYNGNEQVLDSIFEKHSNREVDLTELQYSKRIYPQTKNTFSNIIRRRTQFVFNWRDSQSNRVQNNVTSSFGYIIPTQSVWPLDGKLNFTGSTSWNYGSTDGHGELQNNYSLYSSSIVTPTASAAYYYKYPIGFSYSAFKAKSGYTSSIATTTGFSSYIFRNNANWDAPVHANKGPFYDNYNNWLFSASLTTKDFSILPEFIVSDKVLSLSRNTTRRFTLNQEASSFTIKGGNYTSSAVSSVFEEKYLYSNNIDILLNISNNLNESYFNYFDNENTAIKNIKLKFDALVKFLPYDGFYPAQRTLQIANQFSQSYGDNIQKGILEIDGTITTSSVPDGIVRNVYMPIFAPGILYNTIKAGVAVDFPVLTQSVDIKAIRYIRQSVVPNTNYNYLINNDNFDLRLPFQTIIEPENYIKEITLFDMNPHPSVNISGAVATWNGNGDNYYKYMINNFLAESSEFFLKETNFTYLKSKPIKQVVINTDDLNKEYRSLIKLNKTTNENLFSLSNQAVSSSEVRARYPRPQKFNSETITMYSQPTAFGPPCAGGHILAPEGGPFASYKYSGSIDIIDSTNGYNAPFTPPYYDGESWALLTFKPTRTGSYSLSDIFSVITASYLRYEFDYQNNTASSDSNDSNPSFYLYGASTTSTGPQGYLNLNNNAMQLSASIGLFNVTDNNEWIIKPWFETPILDFNSSRTGYSKSSTGNSNVDYLIPIGMWHQYGIEPQDNAGIFLSIDDIPNSYIKRGQETTIANPNGSWDTARIGNTNLTSSLLKLIGDGTNPFENKQTKLGVVAETKEITETVVAIPFKTLENGQKQYFTIDPIQVKAWAAANANYNLSAREERLVQDIDVNNLPSYIVNQAKIMSDYVIPPQFDFLYNRNVDPILMYCFEFKKTLSKQDLTDIWQNIIPTCGLENNIEVQSIEQDIDISSLGLTNIDQLNNLRWMIFKVKKKAKRSWKEKYYENIDGRKDTSIPYYTFNWPYDYFSLVETGKLTITLNAKKP